VKRKTEDLVLCLEPFSIRFNRRGVSFFYVFCQRIIGCLKFCVFTLEPIISLSKFYSYWILCLENSGSVIYMLAWFNLSSSHFSL